MNKSNYFSLILKALVELEIYKAKYIHGELMTTIYSPVIRNGFSAGKNDEQLNEQKNQSFKWHQLCEFASLVPKTVDSTFVHLRSPYLYQVNLLLFIC